MKTKALVWFKRDLRVGDHAPLALAAQFDEALGVFIIEPQWLASPECDPRHVAFTLACLDALREDLATIGLPLLIVVGDAVEVLEGLRYRHGVTHLLSHEETGTGWSYTRDRAVKRWARQSNITWQECSQTGVVRRLQDRRGWAGRWQRLMDSAIVTCPPRLRAFAGWSTAGQAPVPSVQSLGVAPNAVALPQAGETAARAVLRSFLNGRALGYRKAMSSPLSAAEHCSRLSAYLAFGCISMRQVHQATEAAIGDPALRELAYDVRGFSSRLRWHCHFMQKLEDEPQIEFRNIARSHDGLRAGDGMHPEALDLERLAAWKEGRTGFPMVDACMRQLCATGWLNFRMRAMLVSFASYHLGLHWREPGLHLARQFLDFEPGIHWSQMQMQSGTTGINTLRIYSPSRQQKEHDPKGEYVRRWVPEWGTSAYPQPVVDEAQVLGAIKAKLYGLRKQEPVRAEARAIQHRHGSRRSGLPPTQARRVKSSASSPQGELF
jgi:deoxyribodipyrimidine photo-lyase